MYAKKTSLIIAIFFFMLSTSYGLINGSKTRLANAIHYLWEKESLAKERGMF
jgi:hypothetical protein